MSDLLIVINEIEFINNKIGDSKIKFKPILRKNEPEKPEYSFFYLFK